jgi:hypothetical protein
VWLYVQTRPSAYSRKVCPGCESYPRDRILWHILSYLRSSRCTEALGIVEIGGAARSYWWKKRLYDYVNVDLDYKRSETVDLVINRGSILRRPKGQDVAIISHVFGEIANCATRVRIAREVASATNQSGILIVFEDFDLATEEHSILPRGKFFHKLRLGHAILSELRSAGWLPTVIDAMPKNSILGESELPFILASKDGMVVDAATVLSSLAIN